MNNINETNLIIFTRSLARIKNIAYILDAMFQNTNEENDKAKRNQIIERKEKAYQYLKKYGTSTLKNCIDEIKKSKSGWIKIKKISDNGGYLTKNESESGWFAVFAKGMSLYIGNVSHYYYTSNIVDIDWDKKLFLTLNSIYSFEITEYDAKDMVDAINELISNKNVKHQNN